MCRALEGRHGWRIEQKASTHSYSFTNFPKLFFFFFAFCELHPLCGFLFFSFWLMAKNTSKGFLVSFAPAAPAEEKKEKTPKEFPISQKSNKPLTNQPLPTTETKKKEEKKKKESREKQQQVMLCWLPLFLALLCFFFFAANQPTLPPCSSSFLSRERENQGVKCALAFVHSFSFFLSYFACRSSALRFFFVNPPQFIPDSH